MLACLTGTVVLTEANNLTGPNNVLLAAPALKYVPPTVKYGEDIKFGEDVPEIKQLEESQPEKAVSENVVPADARSIRRLIRQLDADTFADRQAASESLKELGEPVIVLLEEATAQGTGEVISRCIDILKHYTKSGDVPLSQSALTSLTRISEGENKSAAQLAKTAIEQIGPKQNSNQYSRFRVPGANRHFMPNRGFINQVRSMSVQRNNGDLKVEVVENDRKIEIDQKLNNKISITITENGKEPRKIEAKDAAELKEKDEQAFQLFDKYTKQGAAPFDFPGGGPRFGPPAGFGQKPFGGDIEGAFVEMEKQMEEARTRHRQIIRDMQELQRQGGFFRPAP
ncbi:MAG: hypothetical protein COA78_31895 [Blastopirellula sp.]|nr:MAG: hypothetical protein COA78_31895 [Blastopirellula sp.]